MKGDTIRAEQLTVPENGLKRIDFSHKAGGDVPFRRLYLFDPDTHFEVMREAYAPFFAFPLDKWALDTDNLWIRLEKTEPHTIPGEYIDWNEYHHYQIPFSEIVDEGDHVAVPFITRRRISSRNTVGRSYKGERAIAKIVREGANYPPNSGVNIYRHKTKNWEIRKLDSSKLTKDNPYDNPYEFRGSDKKVSVLKKDKYFQKFAFRKRKGDEWKPRPVNIKHHSWSNDEQAAFPEAAYLVDEKEVHDPICEACPRQGRHVAGYCNVGDPICHVQLKEFFARDFYGNLAKYNDYVDENFDIIEKCKEDIG